MPKIWLWPNLLSLDAPLVALLWQVFFARCFGVAVDATAAVLLALTVWLIYSADRTLDAWRGQGSSPRHKFYRCHWKWLLPSWFAILVWAAWLAVTQLEAGLLPRGIAILAAVVTYLGFVHSGRMGTMKSWALLKEGLVGILFALGVTVLVWNKVKTSADVATIVLFSGLCWMNCIVIQKWEGDGLDWSPNLAALILAIAASVLLYGHSPFLGGAELVSACAFVGLSKARPRLSGDALRVLADAALLSPIFFLPAVR